MLLRYRNTEYDGDKYGVSGFFRGCSGFKRTFKTEKKAVNKKMALFLVVYNAAIAFLIAMLFTADGYVKEIRIYTSLPVIVIMALTEIFLIFKFIRQYRNL